MSERPIDDFDQGGKRLREPRRNVDLPAVAMFDDLSAVSIKVIDLSYNGCRIQTDLHLKVGAQFTLSVLGLGKMPASVRWSRDNFAGIAFGAEPIVPATETPRQQPRAALTAQVLIRRAGHKNYFVETMDVSPSGCRIAFVDRPSVGERHWVKFDGMDALEAEVRWVEGFEAGLEYARPIYPAVFEMLLARLH